MSDVGLSLALPLEIDDVVSRTAGAGPFIGSAIQTDVSASYGQFGRRGIRLGDNNGRSMALDVSSDATGDNLLWYHFRMYVTNDAGANVVRFQEGNTGGETVWTFDADGTVDQFRIQNYNGGTDSPYFGTYAVNTWYDVFVVKAYGASGYVKCWIDGTLEFDSGTVNTGTMPSTQRMRLGGGESSTKDYTWFMDVCMGNGAPSPATSFPLNLAVDAVLLPNGNGASSDLTGSDGNSVNNYEQVDEATPDDATTYNGGSTVDDHDGYAMEDWTDNGETIRGVQIEAVVAKSDAGAASARIGVRSNGTDYWGSDEALSTTWGWIVEVYGDDPNGGASWTDARIDGMELNFAVR
jgi:hypothetical protein